MHCFVNLQIEENSSLYFIFYHNDDKCALLLKIHLCFLDLEHDLEDADAACWRWGSTWNWFGGRWRCIRGRRWCITYGWIKLDFSISFIYQWKYLLLLSNIFIFGYDTTKMLKMLWKLFPNLWSIWKLKDDQMYHGQVSVWHWIPPCNKQVINNYLSGMTDFIADLGVKKET